MHTKQNFFLLCPRLDVKYAALHLTYGNKLCFAPLQDPQQALDVGTGTGIWAIDFAEENPGTTGSFVVTIEISSILISIQ